MPAALPYKGVIAHPAFAGLPISYQVTEVSDDPYGQVRDVIGLMKQYAQEDASNPALQNDAQRAVASGDPITDTWNYCKRGGARGMRFVQDETTVLPFSDYEYSIPGTWRPLVENIMRPELLAQDWNSDPIGDCDCFATYGAAHLLSKGVDCAFVTVAADGRDPELFSHVYLVAYPQSGPYAGSRVPLDLSHGPYPGWEVQRVFKKEEWPVCRSSFSALGLIGSLALFLTLYTAWNRKGVFHPSLWRTA